MKRARSVLAASSVVLALLAGPTVVRASVSFDFLFNASSVSDDDQLFLNLTVSSYGFPRPVLEPVLPRLRSVEADLPVILFLAKQSGRPVASVVDLRSRGLGWPKVFTKLHVPYSALFVGFDRDPGPPYGRAWGYWKKNPAQVRLTDADIAGLVQVQVGHHVLGVSPFELTRARARGKTVAAFVADRKGRPYRQASRGRNAAGGPPGQGRSPGPGKGKGRGHDKEHGRSGH